YHTSCLSSPLRATGRPPPAFCFWPLPCINTSQDRTRCCRPPRRRRRPGLGRGLRRPCLVGGQALHGFAYEAAEVAGEAEFEPCEAGDPIRTYTDGLSRVRVGLDDEGTRYFLSADPAKCKGGLKLRVDVRATVSVSPRSVDRAAAAAPAPPASSGTQAVVPLVRRALCLVSVWCFLFLGA
uniref:Phytocyanin domain-containing protein n=1 Tax=Aegilops tauschii subsp. strangulata TaxID=200361 RepID=A0A453PFD7_AEGTS